MEVAILLATFNGEKYLKEMLKSLEGQSHDNFTVYIHDDGSSDETGRIIKKWVKKHSVDEEPKRECGKKYVILEGEATGSAKANFMWMLSQVEADCYLFADQDDVWVADKVEKEVKALEEISCDSDPACVFADMFVVDEKLSVIDESFINYLGRSINNTAYGQILIDNPGAGCTYCFNRKLRNLAIGLKDVSTIPMHDHFILALASVCGQVKGIDEPLVYYRQTGFNEMGAKTESKLDKIFRNLRDLFKGSFKAKKTAFVAEAKNLAWVLLEIEGAPELMGEAIQKTLEEFLNLDLKNKRERRRFYKENNFTRAKGNFWMRLWV